MKRKREREKEEREKRKKKATAKTKGNEESERSHSKESPKKPPRPSRFVCPHKCGRRRERQNGITDHFSLLLCSRLNHRMWIDAEWLNLLSQIAIDQQYSEMRTWKINERNNEGNITIFNWFELSVASLKSLYFNFVIKAKVDNLLLI